MPTAPDPLAPDSAPERSAAANDRPLPTATPPPARAAVMMRPATTMRVTAAPSRAEMAGRSTLVRVTPWDDPLLDQFGHDPRSPYVERFWLAVLGPSATWLLRSFAHRFDAEPDGFTLDLKDTAKALGIGARGGANGALYRTLERVMAFGFAHYRDHDALAVRRRMAPLTRRQQQRLPNALQREHDSWLTEPPTGSSPSIDDLRRRARALALSLLELGEDVGATEEQLHRWRFHPAIAFDSVRWASSVHQHRLAGDTTIDPTNGSNAGDAA